MQSTNTPNLNRKSEIKRLRDEIDRVDFRLLDLVSTRLMLAEKIAREKMNAGMDLHQPQRQKEVLASRVEYGDSLQLTATRVEELFSLLHDWALAHQRERVNEE